MSLVKSRQRVSDHGEVFTPTWLVDSMLDLVKDDSNRIDARFLEPACGSGNFLTAVLQRKLEAVQSRFGSSEFERLHQTLFSLMCLYGIEILEDNVLECRERLLDICTQFLGVKSQSTFRGAATQVLNANILHADALTMKICDEDKRPIVFPEWSYLGKGLFQRRDFRYDALTQMSSFGVDTLFGDTDKHEIFIPVRNFPKMTVEEIALA